MYNVSKNVLHYIIGKGALNQLRDLLKDKDGFYVYLIDEFFKDKELIDRLPLRPKDIVSFVSTDQELTTNYVDLKKEELLDLNSQLPAAVIGIGGGTTLDATKAIANLYTNPGKAENYQGWDLVKNKGIYKIGIPTLSGTGAEASRTCVMVNHQTGLKLGMNSDFTIYDALLLDSELTRTVDRNQYFYTGMDTYVHGIETLGGSHRHALSDAFTRESIRLCKEVFLSDDMMSDENREKLMVASYLGGAGIANSFVGVVHPFSAGLSVVYGTPHCLANCITMRGMEEFYPEEYQLFWSMVDKQGVDIPKGIAYKATNKEFNNLYASTIIHEKPLNNALGEDFKNILNLEKVTSIFKSL
ncbi:MAG: alcohol dehydrogenase [Crocinitomicaceae bacterium]|nr:alcohol dehydrogenase [Crocinitomicaceae bacterium]